MENNDLSLCFRQAFSELDVESDFSEETTPVVTVEDMDGNILYIAGGN